MLNEYHIWELISRAPHRIRVKLSNYFQEKLVLHLPKNISKNIRKTNSSKYAEGTKVSCTRWYNWFNYQNLSIPLWVAMTLTELANLSLEEMEQNIVSYKYKTPDWVCISKPKLPLKFDPVFVSLSSHFCFDGSLPRDGKGAYYSQKNQLQINNFLAMVEHCFGKVYVTIGKDGKNIPKIRLPRLTGDICKHVCGFESFGTFDTNIPKQLLDLPRDYILAILISAIIDEGGIMTDALQLQLSNEPLVRNLKEICTTLGYTTSKIKERSFVGKAKAYYFYIISLQTLYDDLSYIQKDYKLLSLTFKEPALQYIINSYSFPRAKPTIKEAELKRMKILESLNKPKDMRTLSIDLQVRARTLRRHIKHLIETNKVVKEGDFILPIAPTPVEALDESKHIA